MRLSREISKPNLYTRDSTARAGEHLVQPLFSILIYSNHDQARYELEEISTIKDALDPIIPRIPRKQVFHHFSNYDVERQKYKLQVGIGPSWWTDQRSKVRQSVFFASKKITKNSKRRIFQNFSFPKILQRILRYYRLLRPTLRFIVANLTTRNRCFRKWFEESGDVPRVL